MSKKKSSELYEEIQKVLGGYAQEVNTWVRFSERDRKLNAARFVQTLVLGWLKKKDASLNELAQAAKALGVQITGSALHERMDQTAVMLLAGVLTGALQEWRKGCPLPLKLLEEFTGIYITDSSQIALPPALASVFRGNQDNAMLKVQISWDYLHGNLAALELEAGRNPDQKCQLPVSHAEAGSLQLFDLGYFKQEHLRDIAAQGAFFVSRCQTQTALYASEDGRALDIVACLKALPGNEAEFSVLLGGRVKLPVRLVVRRLTPKAADARRRKAKKKAKQQGKMCSATYLFLVGWDMLITNLAAEKWSLSQIFDLYPLRFQIEWLFRVWKDQLGLDEIGHWRVERVLCQLYAHLLGALLCHLVTAPWRWGDSEYSFLKTVQLFQTAIAGLMRCLAYHGRGFTAWLKRLEEDFRAFGRKTKRRKSPSSAQVIYNWGLS